jgi:hypothetical protein
VVDQEFRQLLRDLEQRLTKRIDEVAKDVKDAREAAEQAGKFQDGFQAIARTLAYAIGILVAAATIYGVLK